MDRCFLFARGTSGYGSDVYAEDAGGAALSECSITVRAVQARILENVSLTDRKQIEKNKRDIQNYMDAYEKTWREYETLDNGTASTVEVKKRGRISGAL